MSHRVLLACGPAILFAFAGLPLAGCVGSYPTEPRTVTTLPSFDRSWDAALSAAADVGVHVDSADRAAGRIAGSKAGAEVTIDVLRQADGTLRVSFKAPGSTETNPTLGDRWRSAYQRRMGQ
ncbi:MAG TPA: hypothetical protein VFD82_02660 [Planctomycetota bacterium]|nr:hypothetical protein [Planctomycetota bacterium]